jgi:hypothetical protein
MRARGWKDSNGCASHALDGVVRRVACLRRLKIHFEAESFTGRRGRGGKSRVYDAFMQTGAPAELVVKLVPGGDADLAHLSDRELLANTRGLVGRSNQVFAALLAHLAEVESRGLHRTRGCASLYTYCVYELRFSEDAAARRAGAAKLVKRFPLLLPAIANGELHLTGLLMLGPHFTPENVVSVLGRAKFRTKRSSPSWCASFTRCRWCRIWSRPYVRNPVRCGSQRAKNTRRRSRRPCASCRPVNGQRTGPTT